MRGENWGDPGPADPLRAGFSSRGVRAPRCRLGTLRPQWEGGCCPRLLPASDARVALGAWWTFSVSQSPWLGWSQEGLGPLSVEFLAPVDPLARPPCPCGGRGQGSGPGPRTLTTRPRWAQRPIVWAHVGGGRGRGAAAFHPTCLWLAGTEEQFTEAPAPCLGTQPGCLLGRHPHQAGPAPTMSWASVSLSGKRAAEQLQCGGRA